MHSLILDIAQGLGTILVAALIVYLAYRWLARQSARDRAAAAKRRANQPPITTGGATDGSEDDTPPTTRRRPKAT